MFNFLDNPAEYKRLMKMEILVAVMAIVVMFRLSVMTGALFAAIAGAFFIMDAIVEGLRLLGASHGFSRLMGTLIAIPALAGYLLVMMTLFPAPMV
ncbi:hypothetical protein FAM22280_00045 [Lacticaseibacillus paracasei]|uniref:hypothetical protein n=1 Tax=Lacticaseibacillus paracasei TaxID=1597 RepID=UPI000FF6C6B0|nr:hypothetical protein [Lacticaseibacillus paracasei]RNE15531.1 hypothetical protein FAM22280_00045 [Lacticaseibacillus paracasei]